MKLIIAILSIILSFSLVTSAQVKQPKANIKSRTKIVTKDAIYLNSDRAFLPFAKPPAIIPQECLALPEFYYNEDSTDIYYFSKIDFDTPTEPLLKLFQTSEQKNRRTIIYFNPHTSPEMVSGEFRFLNITPNEVNSLKGEINLVANGLSIFIKVYNISDFNYDSEKWIRLVNIRAMVYSPVSVHSVTPTTIGLCTKLIRYDSVIKEIIQDLRQQIIVFSESKTTFCE